MSDRQLKVAKILLAAVVALTPAILGYCKARQEIAAESASATRESDAGYKVLVASVKHLELVVASQHQVLTLLLSRTQSGGSSAPGPSGVEFQDLPLSPAAALRQVGAE
jgi:hypothetical protein